MLIELRKRKLDGSPYTRTSAVEATLNELTELLQDDLIARCGITASTDPEYVPSECLLYLVRATRHDNSEAWFERLYKELMRRVLRRLPREPGSGSETLTSERIRELALDRFQQLLAIDRQGYCEKLDFFEVAFDSAVSSLRTDGRRRAWREERRSVPIDDQETGEISAKVEEAAGSYNPFETDEIDDPAYRKLVDAAIGTLLPEQREIIEMMRLGFPIESKDPNVMSIAKALGVVEKTVRNRRDRAFATIRAQLQGDRG
jgi:DNA-directed RNA polymerase specialized sigma24 family protein